MKFFYVYILKSEKDGSTYIGFTTDLDSRIRDHNRGKSKFTKTKIPWILVYFEAYASENLARKREIHLKKSSFHKKQLFERIFDSEK